MSCHHTTLWRRFHYEVVVTLNSSTDEYVLDDARVTAATRVSKCMAGLRDLSAQDELTGPALYGAS
jgi:hypothetical protein